MRLIEKYERNTEIKKELEAFKARVKELEEDKKQNKDLSDIQEQAQNLLTAIEELQAEQEALQEEIKNDEKALKKASETNKGKTMTTTNNNKYLETKESLKDFADLLIKTAGQTKQEINNAWKKHLQTKDITNPDVLYPKPVVQAIVDTFENSGSIYATFKKVYGFTSFSNALNTDESDAARAHQHKPGTDKIDQTWKLQAKEIASDYIYKYIAIPKKVLRETQSTASVINYVLSELPQRIVMEIERAAVIGDGRATGADGKITSFEAMTDADTAYTATQSQTTDSYSDVVNALANIRYSGAKYLITSPQYLAALKTAKDSNGSLLLPVGADLNAIIGVDAIFTPQWFPAPSKTAGDVQAVAYVGDSYTVIGDDTIENHENFLLAKNNQEFLAEIYAGGALMQAKSAVKIVAV